MMTPIEWDGLLAYCDFIHLEMHESKVTSRYDRIAYVLTDMYWRFMTDGEKPLTRLTRTESNDFLLGVCLANRGIGYERAVDFPSLLRKRLGGEPDLIRTILEVGEEGVFNAISEPPALHRYIRQMAHNTYLMAQTLESNFNLDARELWETSESNPLHISVLRKRLQSFRGIGDKISRLAERLIMGFQHVHLYDDEGNENHTCLDVVPDVHVCRIAERIGLVPRHATPLQVVDGVRRFANQTGMYPVFAESLWFLAVEGICVANENDCRCFECPFSDSCLANGWTLDSSLEEALQRL